MLTLLDWLFKAQFGLSALIAYNVVLACWRLLSGTASKGGEVRIALALLVVVGGCAAGAWWLQRAASPGIALALLLGFWLLVVISAVVAASQARWS